MSLPNWLTKPTIRSCETLSFVIRISAMKPTMTVVKSPRTDPKPDEKPLSLEEMLALIDTKGTVQERENVVIENLRRQGLIK